MRPAALITGAGRLNGIAAGIAARLADVASLVSFLLSDDRAWVTGQLIHSDGDFSS